MTLQFATRHRVKVFLRRPEKSTKAHRWYSEPRGLRELGFKVCFAPKAQIPYWALKYGWPLGTKALDIEVELAFSHKGVIGH